MPIAGHWRRRYARNMLAAIGLQIAAVAVLALVAGLATGMDSARFLLLGGAVAIVPNALFALRLALHRKRTPESYPVVFFLGEFAKLGLTVGLLALIVKSVPDIRWLPLLIGMIVALKAPLFALAFVRSLPEAKGNSL
ncbi:MAG TPA: ATP synthase subunit I [Burkholderiaceae bacterium]|nr:ATP synthase subunit I [Burkholderiaceae bacterium]